MFFFFISRTRLTEEIKAFQLESCLNIERLQDPEEGRFVLVCSPARPRAIILAQRMCASINKCRAHHAANHEGSSGSAQVKHGHTKARFVYSGLCRGPGFHYKF